MDCLRGPEETESTVHYYPIVDTYEVINLFKLHPSLNFNFKNCCLISLLSILVCILLFMTILVELNVKGVSLEMC